MYSIQCTVYWIFSLIITVQLRSELLWSPGIDSKETIPPAYVAWRPGAGIFKESMGARNRGGIGFSYRPARLHRLAEFIPWNRFLGSLNV